MHEFLRSQDDSHLCVCVVRPWECCKTCRIWSCNVVLQLHVTCSIVYMPLTSKLFFWPDLTFKREPWTLLYQYLLKRVRIDQCIHCKPKLTCDDRTFAVRPIALTHVPSSDHRTTRTMLSLHVQHPFVAQRTHQDVRHIARSITYHCATLA